MKTRNALLGLTVVVSSLALAVLFGTHNVTHVPFTMAAKTTVNFATETITRRVYFANDDWQPSAETYYVQALPKGTTLNTSSPLYKATPLDSTFNKGNGLYYADVTFPGAGASIDVRVTTANAVKTTAKITLPGLSASTPTLESPGNDLFFIGNASILLPDAFDMPTSMSINQVATLLNSIKTCVACYANGYYAYPQLYKDFFMWCDAELSGKGDTTTIEDQDKYDVTQTYTVNAKIEQLRELFETKGWQEA